MNKRIRTITKGLLVLTLLFTGMSSCKKYEKDSGFTNFADVYFMNNSALMNDLAVKYQGEPIEWDVAGKVHTLEGEGKFEFYNKVTGEMLAEKTVNVNATQPDTFLVFQPTITSPIAFLDPNAQANETAPPDGFMKIKIANSALDLLPFNKVDVIVIGINSNFEFINLDTLEAVGQNLDAESYRLVPTGGSDMIAWTFSFMEHGTQTMLKTHDGNDYFSQNYFLYPDMITPYPVKRIYTIYFSSLETWGEYPGIMKLGDKFYEIDPKILFAN